MRTARFAPGIHVVSALVSELFGPRKTYVLGVVGVVDRKVTQQPIVEYATHE